MQGHELPGCQGASPAPWTVSRACRQGLPPRLTLASTARQTTAARLCSPALSTLHLLPAPAPAPAPGLNPSPSSLAQLAEQCVDLLQHGCGTHAPSGLSSPGSERNLGGTPDRGAHAQDGEGHIDAQTGGFETIGTLRQLSSLYSLRCNLSRSTCPQSTYTPCAFHQGTVPCLHNLPTLLTCLTCNADITH